jgi:lia operon protein LiaG
MTKRNTKPILMILAGCTLLAAVLTAKGGYANAFGLWNMKPVHIEKSIQAAGIRNVLVDVESTDVSVTYGNSDDIKVRLDGRVTTKAADLVRLEAQPHSDTLKLSVDIPEQNFLNGLTITESKLTIELPKLVWESVKVHTKSGDVDLEGMDGKKLEAETGSGDVDIKNVELSSLSLQTRSGNIVSQQYTADRLTFQSGSGNVNLLDGNAAVQGETSSGNIVVSADELLANMELKAKSGDVTVKVPNAPQSLAVHYNGDSGEGSIDWDGATYQNRGKHDNRLEAVFGSGQIDLKVSTGSGNFVLGRN